MEILNNTAVLLAAGSGSRLSGAVADKVLWDLAGRAVVRWSADAFATAGVVGRMIVTYRDAPQLSRLEHLLSGLTVPVSYVRGGAQRHDSVRLALGQTRAVAGFAFIHDAARPLIRPDTLRALLDTARRTGNAVLAHRVTDTIKEAPGPEVPEQTALREPPRERLWATETPQVFPAEAILRAYSALDTPVTDDAAAAQSAGISLTLVENPYPNPKLTRPADIPWLEYLAARGH
ncbi:MAG: 2-C-methyl-D-erythritol 4-phosphate cytidylyltransferase [Opitutales bacterium]|nr:2-C-methyl-D-erythritol 4-phosphate cytidylyltransferase [Opitutales bacterium]